MTTAAPSAAPQPAQAPDFGVPADDRRDSVERRRQFGAAGALCVVDRREARGQGVGIAVERRGAEDPDRLREALDLDLAVLVQAQLRDCPSEVRDALAHPDLSGARLCAKAGGQVERAAAVAAVDGDRLAGVQADAHSKRQRRIDPGLVGECQLELYRRAQRFPRRLEGGERLVAAELDHAAAMSFDAFARELRESRGEEGCGFVSVLLRKARVAADVRDQKGEDARSRTGAH
jgi:hypothetical protein